MLKKIAILTLILSFIPALPCFAGKPGEHGPLKNTELSRARDTSRRTITDMRGKKVSIPLIVERVATIDDGFVEGIMTHLGVITTVDVIGSWSMKRDYRYEFESASGEKYEHRGLNTMKFLHPWLNEKLCINSPQGDIINFEALASAKPDVVIMRVGDCTVRAGDKTAVEKTIATIESLGLPLVVTYAPGWYPNASLAHIPDEAQVIGSVFGKAKQAYSLAQWLAETETLIKERTASIPIKERAKVLYVGLDPKVRQQGGAGRVWGLGTPEDYILEEIVHARNAFNCKGSGVPISAEQIYALNPDVIILPTFNGYHPPRELYDSSYFKNLQKLKAVKKKRIYSLPWSPMNCSKRVEYPLDLLIIAKAAYPERFKDINVYEYALELYKKAYKVDHDTAVQLRSTQLLDWMKDISF